MKFVAMYLPQFHDCPLNSKWWGQGFTEWDNVRRAKPLFQNHRQPRIPLNGYYNLDNPEIIQAQAKLAKSYGITGFSIYHYWYEGVRPLAKPLDIILSNPSIELEFSLCWANHSWTRSWKNRTGALDVLIEQTYELNDNALSKHEDFLCRIFADQRYIRLQGKPFLQIYAPESIPNLSRLIDRLRVAAQKQLNVEIHVSAMITAWRSNWSYLDCVDSITLFQPSLALFSPTDIFSGDSVGISASGIATRLRASPLWLKRIMYAVRDRLPEAYRLFDYDDTWKKLLLQYENVSKSSNMKVFPMAFVDFDNTPRYGSRARIFQNYSEDSFKKYLDKLVTLTCEHNQDSIVFLNAWNEWGEGMYLESDLESGTARLDAVHEVIQNLNDI